MKLSFVGLALILLVTIGCNDREKKEQALKDLDDTQQRLINTKKELSNLESSLVKLQTELEVAKDDISQAKEFQLLRTEEERENHIRKAAEYKLKVEQGIENVKSQIEYFKDSVVRVQFKIARIEEVLKN